MRTTHRFLFSLLAASIGWASPARAVPAPWRPMSTELANQEKRFHDRFRAMRAADLARPFAPPRPRAKPKAS